jgi:hypothetical protein
MVMRSLDCLAVSLSNCETDDELIFTRFGKNSMLLKATHLVLFNILQLIKNGADALICKGE